MLYKQQEILEDMQLRKQKVQRLKSYCDYVIIDTDVGGDDAQALIYAFREAKRTNKKILGITCVNGNTYLNEVAKNVLIVQALCDASVPVYLGCQKSLLGKCEKDFYFSKDGLGEKQQFYWEKFKAQGKIKQDLIQKNLTASEFMIECAEKYKGKLGIIGLGPLTNLALAYHLDYSIVDKINIVSLMGGSMTAMGILEFFSSQFNFFLDAHAAKIVIDKFNNIIIVPFDFVLELQPTKTIQLFKCVQNEKGKFVNNIYEVIMKKDPPALCDPLAIAPIFNPELIESYYEVAAEVQLIGVRTLGCVVFDWFQTTNKKKRVKLINRIDLDVVIKEILISYE